MKLPEASIHLFQLAIRGLFLGILLLLSGCRVLEGNWAFPSGVTLNDPEASQEYRAETVGTFQTGQTFGQTFISRRPGLNGIQVWLSPEPGSDTRNGILTFNLYHTPEDLNPLATFHYSTEGIVSNNQVHIPLPPQRDPPNQGYYLSLDVTQGSVQALGRSEDAYPGGQAFLNRVPQSGDLSFRLSYEYDLRAMLGDLVVILGKAWLAGPLLIGLWLPGRVLLHSLQGDAGTAWGERTALSVGLSLAAIPLVLTWTTALGLRWNRTGVWAAVLGLVLVFLWQNRSLKRPGLLFEGGLLDMLRKHWAELALAAIFLLTLGVRLAMARDLAAPPWIDSVHHAMISRLIVEQGAFPPSYAPYLEIETANYHAGFHSLIAAIHWLSGLEIPTVMLLTGQVLNALTVFAIYLFTTTFVQDRLAGLAAALITGLFTPMPAYYTSWGRYTQLASLLVLPAAFALLHRAINADTIPWTRRQRFRTVVAASIACAGLFLVHYRVLAFLACLLLAYLPWEAFQHLRKGSFRQSLFPALGRLAAVGSFSILLTLPWWPGTLSTLFIPKLSWSQGPPPAFFSDFSWSYLTTALGKPAMWLAGMGLAWGALQRKPFPWILAFWVGLLFLLANLGSLSLPGNGFVNNTSVEIMLFIPISALGGYLASQVMAGSYDLLPARLRPAYRLLLGLVVLVLAVFGARTLLPILNPVTMIFREADRPALAWVEKNIPAGETVLINPFAWGYSLYAGSDGGYWITPIAGRKTMPPPALYGLSNNPEYSRKISETARMVIEFSRRPEELHRYLKEQGIHYIYLGAKGGALSHQVLNGSPLFRQLYTGNGTWVFQVE